MADTSLLKLKGRFAGATLTALLAIPAVLLAFGPPYSNGVTFSGLAVTNIVHIHTAMATLWVVMLASQAWLARIGKIPLHRAIGRASYVLAPLIFASMILVYAEQLGRRPYPFTAFDLQVDIFNWVNPIAFLLCWGLAIRHRKNTPRHMRYMISTLLAISTAIIARILLNFFAWLPGLDDFNNVLIFQTVVIALPIAWLIRRDAKLDMGWSPYWVPLISNLLLPLAILLSPRASHGALSFMVLRG